jgi:hypothetical protein
MSQLSDKTELSLKDLNKSEQKPLSQMTKTEIENQDFSWQNLKGGVILLGVILLGVYAYKKLKK